MMLRAGVARFLPACSLFVRHLWCCGALLMHVAMPGTCCKFTQNAFSKEKLAMCQVQWVLWGVGWGGVGEAPAPVTWLH